MEELDSLRTVNVALYVTTAWAYFVHYNYLWGRETWGWRTRRAGFVLLITLGAAGSANSFIREHAVTPITPLLTLAAVLLLVGLWLTRHDELARRPE